MTRASEKLAYVANYFVRLVRRQNDRDLFLDEKFTMVRQYYGNECLDVGCGYGDFAKLLLQQGIDVTGIDIVDRNRHPDVRSLHFDGVSVPFDDKSFSTSIVMFALHHAENQRALLTDVARVTRNYILIAEDTIENPLDRILANIHLHSSPWSKGKDSFHSHAKWLEIFNEHNLRVEKVLEIPRYKEPLYPVSRRVYVLAPES